MKPSLSSGAVAAALAAALVAPLAAHAQVSPGGYPVIADPNVPRPQTTPVIVPLFTADVFNDYSGRPFTYAPPTSAGPWSKIVLVANFSENPGNQYDRTCTITVGGANIYFGTTPEPTSTAGPRWHVERDVTDYASLLALPQTGEADLYNIVNSTYTGVITGSAYLEFYPVGSSDPKAAVPDAVVPLNTLESFNSTGTTTSSTGNSPAYLNNPEDTLYQTATFPTNVTSVYLDLVTQPQSTDEFWYGNVPNDLVDTLDEYGGTAFREAEVTLDDQPAGVAPVYPWIFTGGIDPYLWLPTPGVQTLNFKPYRVDLTPFAALLDDGQPHTVAVTVYNDDSYFSVTGSLLVFQDPKLTQVTGSLIQDTIADSPNPTISESVVNEAGGDVIGEIGTGSVRQFTTEGVVNSSRGAVTTKNVQTISFENQQIDPVLIDPNTGAYTFEQNITQKTSVDSQTTTTVGSNATITHIDLVYPLTVDYSEVLSSDFSELLALDAGVSQGFVENATQLTPTSFFGSGLTNMVTSADSIPTIYPQASSQTFTYSDTNGHSYVGHVSSANGVITHNTRSGGLPTRYPIHLLP